MTDTDDLLARADTYLNDGHVWTGADTLAARLAEALRAANNTITELTDRKNVYFHQCELLGQDLRAANDREITLRDAVATAVDYYIESFGIIDEDHPIMRLRAVWFDQFGAVVSDPPILRAEQVGDDHP